MSVLLNDQISATNSHTNWQVMGHTQPVTPTSLWGEPVVTTGVSRNGQGRASRDEKIRYVKVYVSSVHYFLEELVPFALKMIHTSQRNNQVRMEGNSKKYS